MRSAITIILSVALVGCGDPLTSGDPSTLELPLREQTFDGTIVTARRIAAIDTQYLSVPARTTAGATFEFVVPVAAGGCLGADTTVTRVNARQVTIWPYQREGVNVACPAIYLVDRRTVRVTLQEKGEVRLLFVTRNGPDRTFLFLERRVTVE